MVCMSESDCEFSEDMYIYATGQYKWCVDTLECEQRGGYVYTTLGKCDMLVPDKGDENFDVEDLEKHIYTCKETEESNDMILDVTGEKVRCVSISECNFGAPKGIVLYN